MSVRSTDATTSALPPVENEPGRDALAYRVRTYTTFVEAMHTALARDNRLPTLAQAESDDPSLALVDAWATALDVLTFYQERIANEGFLGTATERRSLQELARAAGYELNPGVAAETYLAFTLDDGPGAPEKVTIEAGIKVQSVPAPGEQAQVFETVEEIIARPEWNALKPQMTELHLPERGDPGIYLQGTNTGLKVGDGLLIVGRERAGDPEKELASDPASERWDFRRVKTVEPNAANGRTKVTWDEGLGCDRYDPPTEPAQDNPAVYAFRLRAALFGHNAPEWRAMPDSVKAHYLQQTEENIKIQPTLVTRNWPGFSLSEVSTIGSSDTYLARGLLGTYARLTAPNRLFERIDPIVNFDWRRADLEELFGGIGIEVHWGGWIRPQASGMYTFFAIARGTVELELYNPASNEMDLLISQSRADREYIYRSSDYYLEAWKSYRIDLAFYNNTTDASIRLLWERAGYPMEVVPANQLFPDQPPIAPNAIHLDAAYPQIRPGSWLVLSSPDYVELYGVEEAIEDARSSFTLSSKTMCVKLTGENLERFNDRLRETIVFAQSEELTIAEAPILNTGEDAEQPPEPEPIRQDVAEITLNRCVDGLSAGRTLLIAGITASAAGAPACDRVALRTGPAVGSGRTVISFSPPLAHTYRRDSVVIYANVACATHGETREETLGGGEAAHPLQTFMLRQAPLTYTPDSTASGGVAALTVRVNGIEWAQKPTLYGLGPRDRAYTAREGPGGRAIIQFGDGTTGARPPSGAENITARYRVGLGAAGNLKPDQLRVLLTRTLGVRGVSNPLPASGGAERDDPDDARRNAPYASLTLGRIVSLRDYEDFARAFGGVAKARADWLWDGSRGVVFITVVGADGKPIAGSTLANLQAAIRDACDRAQSWRVENQEAQRFMIHARLVVQPGYREAAVLEAARAALRRAFSLKRRDFGQDVTESEILGLLQSVAGVEAADLEEPYPATADLPWDLKKNRLTARLAYVVDVQKRDIQPATLLILDDGPSAVSLDVVPDLSQPETKANEP